MLKFRETVGDDADIRVMFARYENKENWVNFNQQKEKHIKFSSQISFFALIICIDQITATDSISTVRLVFWRMHSIRQPTLVEMCISMLTKTGYCQAKFKNQV